MEFEEWEDKYGEEARIKAAETGADRENCFDLEKWLENEYFLFVANKVLKDNYNILKRLED